ncbi:VOC family protein [Methylobacterium sp. J-090]|uniref:VOC family protein n=1 Tax=Methylobacterium sp. J-090 TaxID=2836666 RepID=UPI001FB8F0A6|nr:VOC family protein [Methylobacterium sp. J-090]MCJ2080253.1 VOC family protein [Methylobacterium sp. J-090]
MDPRLTLVTLGVADLARASRFYEALGWTRSAYASEGVAFFQLGGLVLSLYPRTALAEDAGVAVEGSGFRGFALAHNTVSREEADAVMAQAVRAGATLVKPAQDAFWGGYSGYFADPDGTLWEVAWNPDLIPQADGTVRLPA